MKDLGTNVCVSARGPLDEADTRADDVVHGGNLRFIYEGLTEL